MSGKVKCGVVGTGVFGGYHANKLSAHPRIEFIGVYDSNEDRSQSLARTHNVRAFSNFEQLLAEIDAVVIAAPAYFHGPLAIEALNAGKHCLIEKPIAAQIEQAKNIIDLSLSNNLIVQIGHQERFVVQAIGLDKIPEMPLTIEAIRLGPPTDRGDDVSVTLDLMTHDLDVVLMLMGQMPDEVDGKTHSEYTPFSDETRACLTFGSTQVKLTASRLAPAYKRVMEITYPSGYVKIDFNAKTLSHNTPFDLNADFAAIPSAKDSLGAATDGFVSAILGEADVMVNAQDGCNALKLAIAIDEGA